MVANSGRGAAQHFCNLRCLEALHLTEDECAALLRGQYPDELLQDVVGLVAVGPRTSALASSNQTKPMLGTRLVRPFPAGPGTQEVDGQVRADAIQPRGEAVAGVVSVELLPGFEKSHLNHIPGFGIVSKDPGHRAVQSSRMAAYQFRVGILVAILGRLDPLEVIHDHLAAAAEAFPAYLTSFLLRAPMRYAGYRLNTQVLLHHLSPYQFTEVRRRSLVLTDTMLAPKADRHRSWLEATRPLSWQIVDL